MARVKYKNYEIDVWVEIYDPEYSDIVLEFCESVSEAKHYQKVYPAYKDYKIRWTAAEIIDKDGDIGPSVNGETRKEALDKLTKILQTTKI